MASRHPLGDGKEARTARFFRRGSILPERFVLAGSPKDAALLAGSQLYAEGFEYRAGHGPENATMDAEGWVTVALELGDEAASRRWFLPSMLISELPIPLPKRFQVRLPPTLVVATAKELPGGQSELIVCPHASRRGDAEFALAGFARVSAALRALEQLATSHGILVARDKMRGLKNGYCPASQSAVRETLGWR